MNLTLSFPTQRYYRIGVSTFYFMQGLSFATWASRIPDIKDVLHLSDGALGSILFALPLGQLAAMAISGFLVSRFGSRRILSIAACLYPAVLLLLGSVTTAWQLGLALLFFGICGNLSNISLNTQGVGVERLYRRSIMASFHGVWSMAGFAGGVVSTYMVAKHIPPFTHFCIIYAIAFLLMLFARKFMLPRDAHSRRKVKKKLLV